MAALGRIAAAAFRAAADELDPPKRRAGTRRDPASTTAISTQVSPRAHRAGATATRQARTPRPIGFGPAE